MINGRRATARRIVVGVDGSSDSMRALRWAAKEARLRGTVLEVVHVDFFRREVMELFGPNLLHAETSDLDNAVARARALEPEVVVEGRICDPPAAKALIDASDGAEMLVVGSRGLSGMKELMLGSVSSECAHNARCPLVIVRPIEAVASFGSDAEPSSQTSAAHTIEVPTRGPA